MYGNKIENLKQSKLSQFSTFRWKFFHHWFLFWNTYLCYIANEKILLKKHNFLGLILDIIVFNKDKKLFFLLLVLKCNLLPPACQTNPFFDLPVEKKSCFTKKFIILVYFTHKINFFPLVVQYTIPELCFHKVQFFNLLTRNSSLNQ